MKHEQREFDEELSAAPKPVPDGMPELRRVFEEVLAAAGRLQKQMAAPTTLTGDQRRRLNGAQTRNIGFIAKAMEIADARPAFFTSSFSLENMTTDRGNVEWAQQLLAALDQLRRLVDDYALTRSDALYRGGLAIYHQLEQQARSRVPGAEELFADLAEFFKSRGRRPNRTDPTMREIERDFRRLEHGTADGEMVIRHESPHFEGGKHEVVVRE